MPTKLPSIAIGAAVYAVLAVALSFVALSGGAVAQTVSGCAICLAAIVGPLVAVWHYTSTHRLTIPAGSGAGIGAASGALGAIAGGAIGLLLQAVGLLPDAEAQLARSREMMLDSGMDPAQIDQQMEMAGAFSNPVIGIVIGIVIGAVVGAIAGAIGASVFKKGEARMDDPAV